MPRPESPDYISNLEVVPEMAFSVMVVRSAFRTVITGAFALLMLYCAIRVAMQGDWGVASMALLLAAGLAFGTWRWFLRLRAAIAEAQLSVD